MRIVVCKGERGDDFIHVQFVNDNGHVESTMKVKDVLIECLDTDFGRTIKRSVCEMVDFVWAAQKMEDALRFFGNLTKDIEGRNWHKSEGVQNRGGG